MCRLHMCRLHMQAAHEQATHFSLIRTVETVLMSEKSPSFTRVFWQAMSEWNNGGVNEA